MPGRMKHFLFDTLGQIPSRGFDAIPGLGLYVSLQDLCHQMAPFN